MEAKRAAAAVTADAGVLATQPSLRGPTSTQDTLCSRFEMDKGSLTPSTEAVEGVRLAPRRGEERALEDRKVVCQIWISQITSHS